MVAAMRSIEGDTITAVHRTRLSPTGEKLGRRMLGIAAGAAVKIDADDTVTMGLAIGEGIETVLAARQLGFRPRGPWHQPVPWRLSLCCPASRL